MSDQDARFLAWKKNTKHLYDSLLVFNLPWPSTSLSWVPEVVTNASKNPKTSKQRVMLTTNTGNQAPEYLRVAELVTPILSSDQSFGALDSETGVLGGYKPTYAANLRIFQRILVNGIVQVVRIMPQNPNIVSTVADNGECSIFDVTKFPSQPTKTYLPTMTLGGPEDKPRAQSIAQDWSPNSEGVIAIGYFNGTVEIFNIREYYDIKMKKVISHKFFSHEKPLPINDVKWHPRKKDIIATCGDDGWVIVTNTYEKSGTEVVKFFTGEKPLKIEIDSNEESLIKLPTALAWNPVNDSLLAVGFDTGAVELWDIRKTAVKLFEFQGHTDYVTRLSWNTWCPTLLASASVDTTTRIWDAKKMQTEPVFVHGGHMAPVTDVQWNPAAPNVLASVAEDNGFHVYTPSDDII